MRFLSLIFSVGNRYCIVEDTFTVVQPDAIAVVEEINAAYLLPCPLRNFESFAGLA